MGTALRKYKNNCKGTKLSDGKTVNGVGRLTDAVVDKIQTYYGCAIPNNKGNTKNITNVIWAIYYHMIRGPKYETLEEQHKFFPKEQSTTWCKYHEDKTKYDRKKCLPEVFNSELLPVFERLSSKELLDSCQKGLNQNQNQSLNNVVWSRCPKRVFCGRARFEVSVCEAIVQFNEGSKG